MSDKNLIAYHGDPAIKEKYVQRMADHIEADELIRGVGYKDGRGCAVGCTLDRYDHNGFETELGIPAWVAHLCDKIHEGSSNKVWPTFQLEFLKAVTPGARLDDVFHPLLVFIQKRNLERVRSLTFPAESKSVKAEVEQAIERIIELHQRESVVPVEWQKARLAANLIADSAMAAAVVADPIADSAAYSAAKSAWSAAESAEQSSRSEAWSAAESARAAAESARAAADSAANSAAWAAADSAWREPRERELDAIAAEFLRLVKGLEVGEAAKEVSDD